MEWIVSLHEQFQCMYILSIPEDYIEEKADNPKYNSSSFQDKDYNGHI